jgi:peptidoglycan/xylan/chitin deacetylase (PgdA/CDA1 family)
MGWGRHIRAAALVAAAALTAAACAGSGAAGGKKVGPAFEDLHVSGPSGSTPVSVPSETPVSAYSQPDSPSDLSVLVTDPSADWLSLVHGLQAIGIPFSTTTDYRAAIRHRVVLVYPIVSGRTLTPAAINALIAYAHAGHTLIATNVLGGLDQLFGFANPVQRQSDTHVNFRCAETAPCSFHGGAETSIQIGDATQRSGILGTTSYQQLAPRTKVLATFDDGTAAITMRAYGAVGQAIAIGIDPGQMLREGYAQRSVGVERAYANTYQPTADVFLRLIEGAYRMSNPTAVTLWPTPAGRTLTVMLSHDVDFYPSFPNSARYAAAERALGVPATYFIQTKYIRDWEDRTFLTRENIDALRRVKALGMEIASHTVSHSESFDTFPMGTGHERYPSYRPTITSRNHTRGGTIAGETRVSRFLLEKLLRIPHVTSFRSGYLKNPDALPAAIQNAGYSVLSSAMANDSLTHLAYRSTADSTGRADTNVETIPIAIEDQQPPNLPQRLDAAIKVAHDLQAERGTYVVLIHPSITGYKLAFEQALIKALKPFAYFTTIGDYGTWAYARSRVSMSVSSTPATKIVALTVPVRMTGLTLNPPVGYRLIGVSGTTACQAGDRSIVLGGAKGTVRVDLTPWHVAVNDFRGDSCPRPGIRLVTGTAL